jgi:uncharacterized iron-regulated membrane protein
LKNSRLAQKLHKWLGLIVGLQLCIWTLSGFYMVIVDIDIIHGDHLVKTSKPASMSLRSANLTDSFTELAKTNPEANAISFTSLSGKTTYLLESNGERIPIDAATGKPSPQIDARTAESLAQQYYSGTSNIIKSALIETNPPSELGSRRLPIWRIDFDDLWQTSFYISPATGELVTRRHALWRVFDFVWMLHIMDYDERNDINNWILRIVSSLGFLLVVTGVWYLYFRLNVRRWFRRAS